MYVSSLLSVSNNFLMPFNSFQQLHKTAVMVAAYHGHTEIVRAIFKHSIASVHMQDEVRV